MSIQSDLDELNSINLEIARLQGLIKQYKKQKDSIEQRVIAFLKNQETHGVRYNDKAVLIENREYRNKKKKTEKLNDIASVLQTYGIKKSDRLIQDIIEAQRGKTCMNDKLKIINRS